MVEIFVFKNQGIKIGFKWWQPKNWIKNCFVSFAGRRQRTRLCVQDDDNGNPLYGNEQETYNINGVDTPGTGCDKPPTAPDLKFLNFLQFISRRKF